ncbi:MAG: hypothetical protein LBD11_01580 [Candidatus Peribacteria bacterium]|nr:hypothetical protein [Candidatus Peribacteria bacterium]
MKSTTLALATLAVLGISATVWATSTAHRPSLTYPTVTYGSRCGPAQAGSTWVNGTGGAMTGVTSLTIEQTEGEHNVRLPSASPMYYTGAEQGCRFTCLDGYDRDGGACTSSIGVSHDVGNGTITVSDGTHSYTIRDRNEGAIVAGTGKLINRYPGGTCTDSSNGGDCWDPSYGDYFQWGNTYGFANVGSLTTSPTLVPNASTYGPANPYTSSTFITQPGVASASKYDYWTGGQNDNLRGGAGDNGAIEGAGTDADRQGPCPAGFHVPSAGEWGGLLSTRWNATSGDLDSNVKADVYYDYNNGLPYFDYWQTD